MAVSPIPFVPPEISAVIDPINADLNFSSQRGKLVPYLESGRRNDWRCHLVDAEGNTLASHLQWEHLERHTVSMFLSGFERRAVVDFKRGQQDAVNRLHEHNQRVLGLIR